MATQVITITLTDDGEKLLCSNVGCSIELASECVVGSASFITALAFKKHFSHIMQFVGDDVSARMTDILLGRNAGGSDVH